jgi:hypothetical protein
MRDGDQFLAINKVQELSTTGSITQKNECPAHNATVEDSSNKQDD